MFEKWISCFTPFEKQYLAEVHNKWRGSDNVCSRDEKHDMEYYPGYNDYFYKIRKRYFYMYLVYLYILFSTFFKKMIFEQDF